MDRRAKHNRNGSRLAGTARGLSLALGLVAGGVTPVLAESPDRPTHEVQRGDTLYSIVQTFDLPPGVSVNEAMLAFLEANPEAFAEQNVNTLRAGTVLERPPESVFARRDRDSARAEVLRHIENWDPGAVRVEDRFEAVDEGGEGMSRAAIEERLASRDAEIDELREAVEELRFLLESERLDAGTDAAAEELREQMEQDLDTLRTERDQLRDRLVEVEERLVEVESRPGPDEVPLTEQLTRPPVLVALGSMALGLGLFLVAGIMLGRRQTGGGGKPASGGKKGSAQAKSGKGRSPRGDEAEPQIPAEEGAGAAAAGAAGGAAAAAG
ncbi:FimV-like protein, partial [Thioalkalivibrio sp. ALE21]